MKIGSFPPFTGSRVAPVAEPPPAVGRQEPLAEPDKSRSLLQLEKTLDALERMKASAGGAAQDKARAKERLERIKQQIEMLKRMGFPPEVIARRAAELARELGSAAGQFVSALSSDGQTGFGGHAASLTVEADEAADANARVSPLAAGAADKQADGDDGDERRDGGFVQRAYAEIADEGRARTGISRDDRETLEEFRSIARQLKALLEKAIREMREKQAPDEDAREAVSVLDRTIGLLGGGVRA